jgi:hypothetical protein
MAVLTVDSLTGCSSIPSFLGGSGDTPANPSIMIFHQTSAPTNWTKSTSFNNTGLRVIGGANGTALSSGGTLPFTQTFTSRSVGPFTTGSSPIIDTQITQATVSFSPAVTADMSGFPGATQPATVDGPQTAIHGATHNNPVAGPGTNQVSTTAPLVTTSGAPGPLVSGTTSGATAHSHPLASPHTHQIQVTAHSHNSNPGAQGNHSHTYSGSYDFTITYVDVIIATKN